MTGIRVWRDADCDLGLIRERKVAVVGYGNQGRAQALNLRDSGVDVVAGVRPGSATEDQARADGLTALATPEAAAWADVVTLLIPDELQADVFAADIEPHLAPGDALVFGHGFSVHFGYVTPPPGVDALLCAPKGPGHWLRANYEQGSGLACIVAAHDAARPGAFDLVLSYAAAIGGGRVGIMPTSFAEECVADLYGEQTVLCGGMVELVRAAWRILVEEGGVAPHMAYYDVLKEVKLIADLMYERGIAGMYEKISDTAEFGAYRTGAAVVGDEAKAAMRAALKDIRSGQFARDWMAETRAGKVKFLAERAAKADHPIEDAGRALAAALDTKT